MAEIEYAEQAATVKATQGAAELAKKGAIASAEQTCEDAKAKAEREFDKVDAGLKQQLEAAEKALETARCTYNAAAAAAARAVATAEEARQKKLPST
jgi:hypothetical protein